MLWIDREINKNVNISETSFSRQLAITRTETFYPVRIQYTSTDTDENQTQKKENTHQNIKC